MKITYNILNLEPYINWAYFYHAWSVKDESEEAQRLHADAVSMLKELASDCEAEALVEFYDCWSVDDDIQLLAPGTCPCPQCRQNPQVLAVLPMLRQQIPDAEGCCWSISDFISSREKIYRQAALHPQLCRYDKIALFATTMASAGYDDDPYVRMLHQTLCDRIAEAAAERLHEQVRKQYWGYARQENLSPQEMFLCRYEGIRPAVGYPCLPDLSLNFELDRLLHFQEIGITLTTHAMMQPHASVSGMMIAHPKARYFNVGSIGEDQLRDYTRRRGFDVRSYLHATTSM